MAELYHWIGTESGQAFSHLAFAPPQSWTPMVADRAMRGCIGCRFGRKTIVSERINHARPWLIDGVRSTSSAEVLETSALSCGLSLIMSLV